MKKSDHIADHDKSAEIYDSQVKEYHSFGHDILFGMSCEFVKATETLLDLGIGTGLSSAHFARIGLEITGMDGSVKMLEQCRRKNFAKELMAYDLTKVPYPFLDSSFHHVICCGVFHFFRNLDQIFKEVQRVMHQGGIFGFTVAGLTKAEERTGKFGDLDVIESPTVWGIPIKKHTESYINSLCDLYDFEILKMQKVLNDSGDKTSDDLLFKVYVTRKLKN